MRNALLLLPLLAAALLSPSVSRADPDDGIDLTPDISPAELAGHVRTLASDEFSGRRSGTAGGRMAADYIVRRFEAAGLTPIGDEGTFLQHFSLPGGAPDPEGCSLAVAKGRGKPTSFEMDLHWAAFSFSPGGKVEGAGVAFAGYGIHAPDLGYDDYAGLDVKGKVVLVLRHGPREGRKDYLFGTPQASARHLSFVAKARAAQAAGASAMILVQDLGHHKGDEDRLVTTSVPARGGRLKTIALAGRRKIADTVLRAAGTSLASLEAKIDRTGKPASFVVRGVTADFTLAMRERRTANVAGLLPGSDEKLAEEYVVVGAHYDHLGTDGMGALDPQNRGAIRNGADDNASGTAGVIELAEHFALTRERPKRSLVFLCFAGEELGLLGSRHYVGHPLRPLEKTAAMLNMDMIGRSEGKNLFVGGVGTSPDFGKILDAALEGSDLQVRRGQGGAAPSDNMSFFLKGVPSLFFFTGIHADYHRASDDWQKLDYDTEKEIVDLAGAVARSVADLPEKPGFVNAAGGGIGRTGPYLGVAPDQTAGGPGARVARVMPEGPASKAGLLDGDRIVRFDGKEVKGTGDLLSAIRAKKPGDNVEVVVIRDGEETTLTVTLGQR